MVDQLRCLSDGQLIQLDAHQVPGFPMRVDPHCAGDHVDRPSLRISHATNAVRIAIASDVLGGLTAAGFTAGGVTDGNWTAWAGLRLDLRRAMLRLLLRHRGEGSKSQGRVSLFVKTVDVSL